MSNGDPLHILLVEDNPDHAAMILRRIERAAGGRLQARHAASLAEGVAAIAGNQWDAVLLDLQLPDSRGLQTLDAMIRQAARVPVIVLTSLGDEDIATASVQQGAQDYLVKDDFTSEVVSRAIRYAIERKRIEERLKATLAEVAGHAEELELLNRRLEEQNADLNNFNHMISHDLREPIRHLMLFSRKLRSNAGAGLSEKAQRDLQMIDDAARRMESSIAGLQKLSEAGHKHVRLTRVSMDSCLQAALEDLAEPVAEREARITFDRLPDAEADPALVSLLFRNLISNAMKYCDTRPLIHVTAEQDGERQIFGVRDNGIGIDPQYSTRIFAPFQRLHGQDQYGGGSGLGLAICQKIAAGHGGSIWIEPVAGGGSHFRFTLRRSPAGRQEQQVLVHDGEVI